MGYYVRLRRGGTKTKDYLDGQKVGELGPFTTKTLATKQAQIVADDYVTGRGIHVIVEPEKSRTRKLVKKKTTTQKNTRRKNADVSFGAKTGPRSAKKGYKPLIKREGKLGGPGYTLKAARTRHGLLNKAVKRYGYRSTLGSLQVLLLDKAISASKRKVIEADKKWLMAKYSPHAALRTNGRSATRRNKASPKWAKSTIQTLMFSRDKGWTKAKAKSWAKRHGYKYGDANFDVTANYVRIRQKSPSDFIKGRIRTITFSAADGIKATVGDPKRGR